MKFKSKYLRAICLVCAAAVLAAALSVSALAAEKTIEEQMAENSAAWWIAYNAGDQETCDALHAANVALAEQAASGGGSSSYDEENGTWEITTSSGSNISSSDSQDGKQHTSTYTTTTTSGDISATSTDCYSDDSIASYTNHGGTNEGLETSYNNAAAAVTSSDGYGSYVARNTAAGEVAVAKALLGLSDAEARELQRELEASKQAYDAAQAAYNNAVRRGDTAAAERAKAQMDAAHTDAQAVRARYNYTGDDPSATDGGYYHSSGGDSQPSGNSGGFYITATYQITASCGDGGTISPSGTIMVRSGGNQSFSITPNSGYRIKSVVVDGTDKGKLGSYTFNAVTSSHTISASFERESLAITASAGDGGIINPSGIVPVNYGDSKVFIITPSDGYKITSVIVDGEDQGSITSYTFTNITAPHSISASFEKKTFEITASAGVGGSISPSGVVNVSYGESRAFTISPSTGYRVQSVVVDGVNMGPISSYTFSNVTGPHSISASFTLNIYAITASAGSGGSISPSGIVSVEHGGSRSFAIIPAKGYKISAVTVDGMNMGSVASFTFSNVTGPHSISATFTPSGEISLDQPSTHSAAGVDASSGTIKSGYGIFSTAHGSYSDVTDVHVVMTYNFGFGVKSVELEETSPGRFEFPVNAASPTDARCVYIPVATADSTYTLTYTMTAKNAAGETLTSTRSSTITVRGSMYEDDFTGDS